MHPSIRGFVVIAATMLVAGCAEPVAKEAHAECRRGWIAQFNVIFDTDVRPSEIRWFHGCMEKKGFRRIYDVGRCMTLGATVREPECFSEEPPA